MDCERTHSVSWYKGGDQIVESGGLGVVVYQERNEVLLRLCVWVRS